MPELGSPLGMHPIVGDLSDCRKIPFGVAASAPTRFRIVYRLRPTDAAPAYAEVIVIGRRADLSVYLEAVRRLGRTS
jgi:hypothetical protein